MSVLYSLAALAVKFSIIWIWIADPLLVWERLGIPEEELGSVTGDRVWVSLPDLFPLTLTSDKQDITGGWRSRVPLTFVRTSNVRKLQTAH